MTECVAHEIMRHTWQNLGAKSILLIPGQVTVSLDSIEGLQVTYPKAFIGFGLVVMPMPAKGSSRPAKFLLLNWRGPGLTLPEGLAVPLLVDLGVVALPGALLGEGRFVEIPFTAGL